MSGRTHLTSREDEISFCPRPRLFFGYCLNLLPFTGCGVEKHPVPSENIGNGYGNELKSDPTAEFLKPDRGTSLVELLVVLALLSVMILVGAQLVVHSMQLLGATGRAVSNPLVVHVTSRLRHDVQEAAALQREESVWTEEPLVLISHTGTFVSIARENGNLVRTQMAGLGASPERRVILRGVTAWWWRNPVEGVVDLNITYLVNPEPERQASRDVGYGLERRQENLRFAIRGGGGGTRW
jgi:prepilin-type N-terminal cleavage/methylation domain-containing protein